MRGSKLFIGEKLRSLREEHKLTQAKFAHKIGISTSYLNQLENNQRHATAVVLLGLAEHFAVDIASLSRQDSDRLLASLSECFADPFFKGVAPSSRELRLASQNSPSVAMALISTFQALRRTSDQLAELDHNMARAGVMSQQTPYEQVRDYFHFKDNYVHELDVAAEALSMELFENPLADLNQGLTHYLNHKHGVNIELDLDSNERIRTFDMRTRQLRLNRRHPASTRGFQIAHQIALLEHGPLMDSIIAKAEFDGDEARNICRIGLANYFAGALLMPYARFQTAARELRHDLVDLADRFQSSMEQVAHRLSTLQRPGLPGVPLFFARLDRAGNITKRHSSTKLQFARFGSACPLWNAHRAFETPGKIIRQLAETPDGVQYLCVACTVDKPTGGFKDPTQQYALALGCEYRYKDQFVYSDSFVGQPLDHFEPIGISCRICERENCVQRAVPPMKRKLGIDPNSRSLTPYTIT